MQMPLSALVEHGFVRESFFDESKAKMSYRFITHPEIYQFVFGIVNASEKLRKSQHDLFYIKKTADSSWTIECDKVGAEVLNSFQSNPQDMEMRFPQNSLHPAIDICKPYLEDLHYLANSYLSASTSRHFDNDRVNSDYSVLKRIIDQLRMDLNQPSYIKTLNNFLKSSSNNEISISKYLSGLKNDRKELKFERMQLHFKKTPPSLQPMGEVRNLKDPRYASQCEDFKESLLSNVIKAWKGILVGYISKTHYTHNWGFVVHLILIFDGACPVTYGATNFVGEHWSKVTQGEGEYEAYKKYEKDGEVDAKSPKLRDFGIGFYGKKDKAKFAEFVEKVVIFLARTDKYVRFTIESPRIDSLKRGSPALAKAKNELNKYSSMLPAILQPKNKPLIKPYCA